MKFNIAAKLGLLAAGVSLVATAIVGLWALGQSRKVLVEHELVDLTDETELRVYELMNDFRYLRRDVYELTNPLALARSDKPSTVNTLDWVEWLTGGNKGSPAPTKAQQETATESLLSEFEKMLGKEENYYYLELCCMRVDEKPTGRGEYSPLLAVGRRTTGQQVERLKATARAQEEQPLLSQQLRGPLDRLLQSAVTARSSRRRVFPVQAQAFAPAAVSDGNTPMLLTVASPIARETTGMPRAMLLLTIDFEEFLRYRARHLPRHLLYLANDQGRLLFHPDPDKQKELRKLSSRGPNFLPHVQEEPALASFKDQFQKSAAQQQDFRKERGAGENRLLLPEMEFHYAVQRLQTEADRQHMQKHWEAIAQRLADLSRKHPGMRFHSPTSSSGELQISCPQRADLEAIEKELLELQRSLRWDAPGWSTPIRCKNFAVRFMLLNPDLDSRDRVRPDRVRPDTAPASSEPPRYFGLAMAASLEEIEQDIDVQITWMWWVVLALGGGAALVAWGFSKRLTRPLSRIIRATETIATGTVDSEVPEPLPVESRDEIGKLARSFENMREQLKARRDALVDTIARMKAVLDTAAEGVILFDERGAIESYNQAAERIFGWKAAEMHGQKIDRLITIALKDVGQQPGASDSVRIVNEVVQTRGETAGRRKDGSTFPMEVAFSEVPLHGRKVITGIFRDITERKKAEAEIRRANEELDARVRLRTFELEEAMAKLETALQGAMEASRAKDAFMANMNHELRTPLTTVIMGVEEIVQDGFDDTDDLNGRLDIVLSQARHLLGVIEDILDLSKIGAGRLELSLEDFDLVPVLRDIQAAGKSLTRKYPNELLFEIDPHLGRMWADQKRLKQILLNLLSNACKFTDRGRVTVRAWREQAESGDTLVFQVQDTGKGMAPEDVRRLGELFFQVDQTNKSRKGGTGLGMAITRNFTRMMCGTFEVSSEPGKGSQFTVRLPARVEPERAAPVPGNDARTQHAERAAQPNGQRDLVLVVDDDPDTCALIERFLLKEALRVKIINSGSNVVELARQLRPAAITLDVLMPGLDGWTLLAALKTDPVTADIPVIMLTIEDNPRRGFSLGASEYLTKPIDWTRLAAILHRFAHAASSAPIQLVEDNEENRTLLARMLHREGRATVLAENGRVALRQLEEGLRPALILLDLLMPEMNGFEFLDQMRRRPEWAGIPVVVVTAKDLTEEDRRRLKGGVAAVLSKSGFSTEELLEHLRGQVQQFLQPPGTPAADVDCAR